VLEPTEIVKVEVADVTVGDRGTLLGLADAPRPAGEIPDSEIVPENPFKPLTVITEVAEDPA